MSDRFRRQQKLKALFSKTNDIKDAEILSHWARYLCVQTYGYAERTFVEIVEDYCRKSSCPRTFSFVSSKLKRLNNVSPAEVEELLTVLDENWANAFKAKFEGTTERDHFASITANRNKIAHGEDSGLRMSTMTNYLISMDKVLDGIEQIVQ